ncbi:hypothetical protein [Neobacillus niacini]|uniref:hypothetical protein n=1 Tax=Neobacillus niacini TaxID=86668 RepID=UPI0021CB894D|nr:hypothetical protein [Neobacillus niacini]MCM3765564.1 hypothetical protein [Neobacillus niacini]
MTYNKEIQSILGFDVHARSRFFYEDSEDHDPFKNPIIHKQINGRVIVPLNVEKLFGK